MAASVDMHGRGVLPSHTSLPPAMSAYARPDDHRLQHVLPLPPIAIRSVRVEVAELFQLPESLLYQLPFVLHDLEMEIMKPPRMRKLVIGNSIEKVIDGFNETRQATSE